MGQRFQTFIRIKNPLKKKEISGAIYNTDEADKKEAELYFGKGKYSIIPFHHQWLYGTTAVGMLVAIMKQIHLAKGDRHPFSKDLTYIPYDTDHRRDKKRGYGLIEFIQQLISITDFEVSEIGGRFGVERLHYIGDEHYDYETKEKRDYSHQENCDYGDNNDGIMIIDVPSKKYCFMNISEQYRDCTSASRLPQLEPVSALNYQKAYYPTTKLGLSLHTLKEDSKIKIKETLIENREMAKALKLILEPFDILSLAEVKKIFPKTYKEFEKEKTKKLAKATK